MAVPLKVLRGGSLPCLIQVVGRIQFLEMVDQRSSFSYWI